MIIKLYVCKYVQSAGRRRAGPIGAVGMGLEQADVDEGAVLCFEYFK